ncbi:MAG: MFS transporter [Gemmataceae bacterium]
MHRLGAPGKRNDGSSRRLTLLAALLGWSFDGIEMGLVPVIARPALSQLLGPGTSEELIRQWNGTLAIAFLLGAAIGGVFFGWLGDRIGRVRAMALAVLAYSGLTGLSALAATPAQLAWLRFAAALGMGGEWALGVALVVETWPDSARPWLAGIIGAAVSFGYIIAAVVSAWADPANWRMLFALCALPALLTFFLRTMVPESPRWQNLSGPKPRIKELFGPRLRQRTLLGITAGSLVMVAIWGAIQSTQVWAQSLAGPAAGAKAQIVSAAAAMVGAIVAPVSLARRSRKLGYAILSAAAFLSAEYLFLGHAQFGGSFLISVGIAGLCTGAFNGWLPLYLPELFPTRLRATGQGTCYNAGRVLAAAGVWMSISPMDFAGNYARAGAIVAGAYGLGILLAWWLPETVGKDLE